MAYEFKNGVATKASTNFINDESRFGLVMSKAGYSNYLESKDLCLEDNPFEISVYVSNEYTMNASAIRWVVFVFDKKQFVDEYHVENSFDLATLVNTFCTPLASQGKLKLSKEWAPLTSF